MVVTVPERKARTIARLRAASEQAVAALRTYAVQRHGRFLIFGSFARGDIRFDSDFDVVVDFDPSRERAAAAHAEEVCRRFGVVPDVHIMSEISPALKARVERDAVILP